MAPSIRHDRGCITKETVSVFELTASAVSAAPKRWHAGTVDLFGVTHVRSQRRECATKEMACGRSRQGCILSVVSQGSASIVDVAVMDNQQW